MANPSDVKASNTKKSSAKRVTPGSLSSLFNKAVPISKPSSESSPVLSEFSQLKVSRQGDQYQEYVDPSKIYIPGETILALNQIYFFYPEDVISENPYQTKVMKVNVEIVDSIREEILAGRLFDLSKVFLDSRDGIKKVTIYDGQHRLKIMLKLNEEERLKNDPKLYLIRAEVVMIPDDALTAKLLNRNMNTIRSNNKVVDDAILASEMLAKGWPGERVALEMGKSGRASISKLHSISMLGIDLLTLIASDENQHTENALYSYFLIAKALTGSDEPKSDPNWADKLESIRSQLLMIFESIRSGKLSMKSYLKKIQDGSHLKPSASKKHSRPYHGGIPGVDQAKVRLKVWDHKITLAIEGIPENSDLIDDLVNEFTEKFKLESGAKA